MMKTLKCVKRKEKCVDKNGKEYVHLEFKNFSFEEGFDPITGEVYHVQILPDKVGVLIQYHESYTSTGRADVASDVQEGQYVAGEVLTRDVVPYYTDKGTLVNYYTCVVLGDSRDPNWNKKIEDSFKRNGRVLIAKPDVESFNLIPNVKISQPENV